MNRQLGADMHTDGSWRSSTPTAAAKRAAARERMVEHIDMRRASATVPEDAAMMLAQAEALNGGVSAMNQTVREVVARALEGAQLGFVDQLSGAALGGGGAASGAQVSGSADGAEA
jgi:hypothetical protein